MSLKLYSYPNNPRVNKVLIAAKYVGVDIETPAFNMDVDNKTPEFLAKFPVGKVPALETPEGGLFESNAIARYVARLGHNNLYGKSAFEAGQVEQWIEFITHELDLPAMAWLYPIFGFIPNNPQATAKAQQDIKKVLQILDHHLLNHTYLVGNHVSLADIIASAHLLSLFTTVLDKEFRKPFVNVVRWFVTLVNQPNFHAVLGDVHLVDVAQVAKKEEKPKPKKEEKPKAEPKPKEEKPKKVEKPKEVEEEEEEEDYKDEEPKGKNPLDLLPKSNFVLDEWKRVYSNQETRPQALPWFWEHFDKEGYSIYFSDYKYNNELTKVFLTNNLIGGFFQRLEKLHKYAFGSMVVLGEEPQLTLQGVWVFRGPEVPAEMTTCDDYEVYNWTRFNSEDPSQKKLLEDYFAWDSSDEFGGRGAFLSGKAYK